MKQFVARCWYRSHLLSYLLLPFAGLYRVLITCRAYLYRLGVYRQTHFSVPVIIVGNISVGGTGKTPLVIALSQYLQAQGYQVGLVSRGYGGAANHSPCWVTYDSDPREVGDEALLLVRRTQVPMVIARDRVAAVRELLAKQACDVIISDDGLQHYALGRDIEIVVVDGERRFGNQHCLPAGPLREPVSRLKTVDFIVSNGIAQAGEFTMQLQPDAWVNMLDPQWQQSEHSFTDPIHVYAGIGNPQRFFAVLRRLGLTIIEHDCSDHHVYSEKDFANITGTVLMTEKDAVKCQRWAKADWWYLPVIARLDDKFLAELLDSLGRTIAKKE